MGREKIRPFSGVNSKKGSSPHGRGKGVVEGGHVEVNRITPAWAGKSLCSGSNTSAPRDHPRMGGEKSLSTSASIRRLGSPPRWRGKGSDFQRELALGRITPAWAGKRAAIGGSSNP